MSQPRSLHRDTTIHLVASDSFALDCLRGGKDKEFIARLRELAAAKGIPCTLDDEGGTRNFASWCNDNRKVPSVLPDLLREWRAAHRKYRRAKDCFIRRLGLNSKKFQRGAYLSAIPTKVVVPLAKAYPPLGHIILEMSSASQKWVKYFHHDRQPDRRKRRLPIHKLQPAKLAHDVCPEESAIFTDDSGRIVGMVIRNFCPDNATVQWAESVVADAMPHHKNIRMEDTGKLVQVGYSAGARSRPQFDWVRNLLRKPHNPALVAKSDVKCSSVFAFAWQLMRARLPEEIISDFDNYLQATGLKRMDGNGQMGAEHGRRWGTYSIAAGQNCFDFHNVELAPPTGVFGQNYSRAIHKEKQPHTWAASWTLSRSGGAEYGCHFYLARYGIRIQAAANTLIVWIPEEEHGTSVPDLDPYDANPAFCQRGLAFVTSNRLPGIWRKYLSGLLDHARAEAEIDGDGEDSEDYGDGGVNVA